MSNRKLIFLLVGITVIVLLLSACGASPEEAGREVARGLGPTIKEFAAEVFKGLQEFVRGILSGG